ncbi:bifunctional phosphoribosylaminoimidazolecarboxamide formyltransferase/IMP cyclohydrolase [Alicyclobacillus hesperidum]|uniref:bifunctional phosphoribosylaminoimidazolecarboxamide formyltransferase/IMP cyclohydrolase n=1 Tax=Alicyclobacillus hesperidum TaxID=89784 RepID=UPI0007193780|nr:bifunctional phosphoribosylaminoimidazolecarboxamide formyltransferase/IMP cyclohydrolase [Alicyclobacillus hesperidum]KRW92216.1 phosphoribosylaminoimidazolecarboxamide formyltransferase [Alicyclobacillus tengchongensis]
MENVTKLALVSVYDKEGIVPFCEGLVRLGYQIISTGGTAKLLAEHGIAVKPIDEHTGFPEMLDGRVKTLHPKVHGGLLARRDNQEHMRAVQVHGIELIDLVVVNLYPFQQTIARPDVTDELAIEMIDIGGPAMLRSAAKNHEFVLPVIDPADYDRVLTALQQNEVTPGLRRELAAKVFAVTARYDALVADYLAGKTKAAAHEVPAQVNGAREWPGMVHITGVSKMALRYGENPHQVAHFYMEPGATAATIARAEQLQGKELSYNNIQDADAALNILRAFDDFEQPVAVAVKHMNPCGIGRGETIAEAFGRAYEADPVSIFGGIVALNRPVDGALAEKLANLFLEIVIAPAFLDEARSVLAKKKNLRLLIVDMQQPLWTPDALTWKRVSGGFLIQAVDQGAPVQTANWQVVTARQPSAEEYEALRFAWKTVQFVKSNAIVLATTNMTLGVGAGQMNRVGAAEIAIAQAGVRANGSVLASDAFFPMRDTVDAAAKAGVTAIVQPGGSIRDAESIDAANEYGIAMVFTGERHFLH